MKLNERKLRSIIQDELIKCINEVAAPLDHPMWEISPTPSPRNDEEDDLNEGDYDEYNSRPESQSDTALAIDEALEELDRLDDLNEAYLTDVVNNIQSVHAQAWSEEAVEEYIKTWLIENGYRYMQSNNQVHDYIIYYA